MNNHMKSEMLSNRHTQTHRPSTVTLAANARRGLIVTEVGSSTSSPGVLLHEWLDEDSKESLNDEERINRTKAR